MTIYIEKDYVIRIEDENKTLKAQRDGWEKYYYEVVEENDKQDDYIDQLKQELFNLYLKHYN